MEYVKNLPRLRVSRRERHCLLWFVGLAAFLVSGCAQNHATVQPASGLAQPPRSEGLVAAGKFRSLAIADLNSDGHPDVIGGAAEPGYITLSFGTAGADVSEAHMLPIQGDVNAVTVGDVNEDGRADVIYSVQRQSSGISIFLNDGDNRWRHVKGPTDVNTYQGIKTADVNRDGHLDLIAANATSETQGGIQVWLGDGKGRWTSDVGPTVTGTYMDVLPLDVNQDGNIDLVGSGWGLYGALRLWLGNGTGQWTSTPELMKGSFYGLSTADVNADGHPDILAGSYRHGVVMLLGDGNGNFSVIKNPPEDKPENGSVSGGRASYWQTLAVDLDHDGQLDVAASSLDNSGVKAWLNRGPNDWKSVKGLFPHSGNYYTLAQADLNGDGKTDLCGASFGEGIKIWSGDRQGILTTPSAADFESRGLQGQAVMPEIIENDVFKTINGVTEYKVGPGDLLEITHWDANTSDKEEILVRPDGNISYGLVEDLPVSGLTSSEIDKLLTARLQRFVKQPRIDVTVKEHKSKYVRILGAVVHDGTARTGAGKYKLDGRTTVLEMLTQAGGPTQDADLKSVRVRRRSGQTMGLNLYQAIIKGDMSQDLVLDNDDLIYLPSLSKDGNRVYVFGEVKNPGAYTFAGSEMRLLDAISEAGGPTVFASASETRVVRGDISQPEILTADFTRLIEQGDRSQNVMLASGDLIYVPRSGLGDVKLFSERIRPLLELILWPARVVNDWDSALDVTGIRSTD